jgi:hypothetical protein
MFKMLNLGVELRAPVLFAVVYFLLILSYLRIVDLHSMYNPDGVQWVTSNVPVGLNRGSLAKAHCLSIPHASTCLHEIY